MRLPALFALALAVVTPVACKEPPPPPPVPAVDPRVDAPAGQAATPPFGGSTPDAELDDQARFALALTGHRRKDYTGDLDTIKERGVLRVLTRNNSTSYFLYKGVEAGWDYELG